MLILLDTFVIMVLIRVFSGEENEGWVKPGILAVLSSFALIPLSLIDSTAGPDNNFLIVVATLAGAGVCVVLGCWILLDIPPLRASLIGGLFVCYKIAFLLLFAMAMRAVYEPAHDWFDDIIKR